MASRTYCTIPPPMYAQTDQLDMFAWLNQLKYVWGRWKKSEGVSRTLHEYFDSVANPYVSALCVMQNCDDFKQAKPNSLSFTVMEEFGKWLEGRENGIKYLLTNEVKMDAFIVITKQHNMSLIKMVCSIFKMLDGSQMFVDPIKMFVENKQYKEACQIASFLKLHDRFGIEDFIIPLVLQDKVNIVEEFLLGSFYHQKELVLFLDNFLGHRNTANEVDLLIKKLDVPDVKRSKMMCKPLSKLVGRLLKMYNLPGEMAPNLNRKRNEGAVQFLIYKRYVEHSLGKDSFREMLHEATANNPSLHQEVIVQLNLVDLQEAVFWAKKFAIPKNECPIIVRELLDSELHDSASACPTEVEENWDEHSNVKYHTLLLPDSQIVLVDNPAKFREFLNDVSNAEIVGIDSEWKPQFGTIRNGLALLQVATRSKVYILDIISTGSHCDCPWEEAGAKVFGNEKLIKLGFGVSTDLNMMFQCIPCVESAVENKKGYLDLTSLWKRLIKECNFKFPYTTEERGESLTDLVELCLGKRLDKSDQFSNWERRPLRESQIRYAALDAFCLIEVFDVLKESAEKQEIPFRDICEELISKTKYKTKTGSKNRRNRRGDGEFAEIVCPFESPISVTELKMLCDRGLEGLGQQLRKVGIDTLMLNSGDNQERCIQIAKQESRIVIVRGRPQHAKISQYVHRGHCYPVSSDTTHDQLREVLLHFNVRVRKEDIFSRCKLCNGASFVKVSQSTMKKLQSSMQDSTCFSVDTKEEHYDCSGFSSESDGFSDDESMIPVSKSSVQNPKWVENVDVKFCRTLKGAPIQVGVIAPECIDTISEFNICEVCGRVYWDGSHYERFVNGKIKDIICE